MESGFELLWWLVALGAIVIGFAGIVLPLLPGMPLLFGGLWLAAGLDGYSKVSVTTVVILAIIAVVGSLVDYVAAAIGVKRAGASGQAMAGAGAGAAAGIFGGLPGLILGPILGAMAGEWHARRNPKQAMRAGMAAGLGFVVAIIVKLLLGVTMVALFTIAYFL